MNTQMNLRRISVEKLKPAKYNPRKDLRPGDPAYEKIKRSLHDFGYVDPVIWNEVTGNIVGGHQRYKVLLAEGVTEIDCVVVHIEDAQAEKALNIALNKAVGEWEPKALADLLTVLQLSGYDLGATGFDAAEVDDLFSQVHDKDVKDDDCELDAEEVTPFVKSGDLWTLGRHRMLCGDATNADDVARLMDGIRANLVVTDPPYNVAYESADGKKIQNDSMADETFYAFLLAAFRNMAAHLAEGGSAYIFHADTEGLNFRRAFREAGFHISGVCVWVKNSLVLGRSPYQWQHEPVLYGWLPNGKHKWFSDRKQSTVDFLTKKQVVNRGVLPQYYVEDDHEAIIDPETFDLVQQEMLRRRQTGNRYSGVDIFASRLVCGECGSYYGAKVWHSNSKYRKVIYRCNHKYHEGKSCGTPHLTEDEIRQGFVTAVNRLLEGKAAVISNLESLSTALFDTSEMETTAVKLKAEMELVQEMIQKAVAENARVALDQKEYKARFDELSQRLDALENQHKDLEHQIADRISRQTAMRQFIGVLKK